MYIESFKIKINYFFALLKSAECIFRRIWPDKNIMALLMSHVRVQAFCNLYYQILLISTLC